MAALYKHHIPSSTSLSDDNDDDEVHKSLFFPLQDTHPFPISPAQWSHKRSLTSDSRLIKDSVHSPMTDLPPEILIHILKHLHSPRDLFNCLRVSRTWCECAVELLWHKPSFPKYDTLEKMARLLTKPDQSFNYAHFIRRLNFLSLGNHLKDDVFSIFARCDRLERLTLVNCEYITGESLSRVLPCFTDLVAVDLSGVVRTTNEAVISLAVSARRLQGINLAGCTEVSDSGVMALALNCPLLRRVKLSNLETVTDAPIQALARCCPLLLEIDLNHCHLITDVAVREIWLNSTHMRELRLSYCPQLTDAAFPAPLKPEILAQIDNPNPFPNSKTKLENELLPLILTRQFVHLRMLDLTACSLVTDEAIEGIISQAPKIRNLVLSKCSLLTDRSVENICRLGRHLHYLHLGHASKITDRSVRTLARSCTRLRYIDFANCTLLTDMSVFELATLPKLRRIGLVRVNNLTDEAIYALAERHATLERIHLSYCDQISVMAIHFLLQKLHKLTHLSLTGIPAFRQPELQQFCREPPRVSQAYPGPPYSNPSLQEFSAMQQSSFCVFSGRGVSQLRAFLTELFDHMTEMNGTDDTEYDDDEFEQDEETPEPEMGAEADEEELTIQDLDEPREDVTMVGSHQPLQPPITQPSQPHVYQYNRQNRSSTVPPTGGTASSYLSGPMNSQVYMGPASGLQWRPRGQPLSSVADNLPVVESAASASPPASDAASNRSGRTNNSNGAGFFGAYHDTNVASSVLVTRNNGALTPDLDFAEIGHGRGIQAALLSPPSHLQGQHQPYMLSEAQGSSTSHFGFPVTEMTPSIIPSPVVGELGQSWPQQGIPSQSSSSLLARESHEPNHPVQCAGDRRGRNVKRSLRSKLNAAEQYASSLFGRSTHGDGNGNASGSRS
ncbi:hypothetical protein AMATHDRAFT_3024 [Amanita thiersii Skay4041]|uniref:Uncharacterized protein n=1 Tax=Amanita thiersii Skay4041 TaxID=703135 RepID=A0A2A9NK56_9AGAR|nr:hypothetical protein AMATHDRAFT_3024 [Amanita thiersii Skay4041]